MLSASAATAQTADWDRQLLNVSAAASPTGPVGDFDVDIFWQLVVLSAPGGSSDVGTEVAIRVNGTEHSSVTVTASDPGLTAGGGDPSSCPVAACSGSCGSMTIGGSSAALSCATVGASCLCQSLPIKTTIPGVPLRPEDYIEVLLRPAPGALPDFDPSDDIREFFWGSWDRRIASVETNRVPPPPSSAAQRAASAGDVFFDVWVECTLDLDHIPTIPLELGSTLELRINGVPQATHDNPECIIWDIKDSCTHTCAAQQNGSSCGTVSRSGGASEPLSCENGFCRTPEISFVFPAIPITPDDEITVLLRPAPGALPELPGFGDDMKVQRLPGNVPAVSTWGLFALLLLLATAGAAIVRTRSAIQTR